MQKCRLNRKSQTEQFGERSFSKREDRELSCRDPVWRRCRRMAIAAASTDLGFLATWPRSLKTQEKQCKTRLEFVKTHAYVGFRDILQGFRDVS